MNTKTPTAEKAKLKKELSKKAPPDKKAKGKFLGRLNVFSRAEPIKEEPSKLNEQQGEPKSTPTQSAVDLAAIATTPSPEKHDRPDKNTISPTEAEQGQLASKEIKTAAPAPTPDRKEATKKGEAPTVTVVKRVTKKTRKPPPKDSPIKRGLIARIAGAFYSTEPDEEIPTPPIDSEPQPGAAMLPIEAKPAASDHRETLPAPKVAVSVSVPKPAAAPLRAVPAKIAAEVIPHTPKPDLAKNAGPYKALVTGGGGFLGRAIVRRLLAEGMGVRSFARGDYPDLRRLGVELVRGDLADVAALKRACAGCDVVFHVAALAGVWGAYEEYHRANVVGTQNVIEACKSAGVRRLIYTSSPSVVFADTDMEGVSESAPYPKHFNSAYPKSKALAEQFVLAANSAELATVALRPHLIWGPGDRHLVPRILLRAKRLRRIGDANKKIDSVYIDNAAEAHLLAAKRLHPGAAVAGKAYFITNGEPRALWDLVNGILAAADQPPVTRSIPRGFAFGTARCLEIIYSLFGIESEPTLTRFVAKELSTAHWFDISAARRDLGYAPSVSIDDGLGRLRHWLHTDGIGLLRLLPRPKDPKRDKPRALDAQSKALAS